MNIIMRIMIYFTDVGKVEREKKLQGNLSSNTSIAMARMPS